MTTSSEGRGSTRVYVIAGLLIAAGVAVYLASGDDEEPRAEELEPAAREPRRASHGSIGFGPREQRERDDRPEASPAQVRVANDGGVPARGVPARAAAFDPTLVPAPIAQPAPPPAIAREVPTFVPPERTGPASAATRLRASRLIEGLAENRLAELNERLERAREAGDTESAARIERQMARLREQQPRIREQLEAARREVEAEP